MAKSGGGGAGGGAGRSTGAGTKTLYHGTAAAQFDEFREGKPKRTMQLGFGVHFTEEPGFAQEFYAGKKGGRVITAKVDLGRMLDADQIVYEGSPEFALAERIAKASRGRMPAVKGENGLRGTYLQNALDVGSPQIIERELRAAGYDSVRYQAKVTGGRNPYGQQRQYGQSTSYVILDPKRARIVKHKLEDSGG